MPGQPGVARVKVVLHLPALAACFPGPVVLVSSWR
jgi:hypothetical protein